MVCCAVAGCSTHSRDKKRKEFMFHRFPSDPTVRAMWVRACMRHDEIKVDTARVCSGHFDETDYARNLKSELLDLPVKRVLKPDAVPHLGVPTSLHCKTRKGSKKKPRSSSDCGANSIQNATCNHARTTTGSQKEKLEVGPPAKKRNNGCREQILEKKDDITCCALSCLNTSDTHTLTPLPQEPERRSVWIAKIDRPAWRPTATSALCPIHFSEDAWDGGCLNTLKSDATPSLYLNGEAIRSSVTLDKFGNVETAIVRSETDSDSNVSVMDFEETTIKQEILDSDIDMKEGSSGKPDHFETVYLPSSDMSENYENDCGEKSSTDCVKEISLMTSACLTEAVYPEVKIKTEVLEETDINDEASLCSCEESGEKFVGKLDPEKHLLKQHPDSEHTHQLTDASAMTPIITVKSEEGMTESSDVVSTEMKPTPSVTPLVSCGLAHKVPPTVSASKLISPKSSSQLYVILSQGSSGRPAMLVPLTQPPPLTPTPSLISSTPVVELYPSIATDSSENFTVSLAHFPEAMRPALKKKMLEVIVTVEKLKVNPSSIIVAHKPQTTTNIVLSKAQTTTNIVASKAQTTTNIFSPITTNIVGSKTQTTTNMFASKGQITTNIVGCKAQTATNILALKDQVTNNVVVSKAQITTTVIDPKAHAISNSVDSTTQTTTKL